MNELQKAFAEAYNEPYRVKNILEDMSKIRKENPFNTNDPRGLSSTEYDGILRDLKEEYTNKYGELPEEITVRQLLNTLDYREE